MKKPKVSLIIPVYNGAKYVEKALESAFAQTYDNLEIIVVNDGSKDNTDEIMQKYKDKVKYLKKENGGVSTALNLAIDNMTGDYFSWLSHDDEYFPTKIEEDVKAIQGEKKALIISDYCAIDENDEFIENIEMNHDVIEKNSLYALTEMNLNGITLLIPKKAFDECGKFDPNLRCTQDYELWFKMLKKGYKFKHLKKILAKSRQHREQTTYQSPNTIREGNELWIKAMKEISSKDKKELYGSEYKFYSRMLKIMYSANYIEAFEYAKEQIIKKYPDKEKEINKLIKEIKSSNNKSKLKSIIARAKKRSLKENFALLNKKVKEKCKRK